MATFFTFNFLVNKENITDSVMPVIVAGANNWHGLDALLNPWNVALGLASCVLLARVQGLLYF